MDLTSSASTAMPRPSKTSKVFEDVLWPRPSQFALWYRLQAGAEPQRESIKITPQTADFTPSIEQSVPPTPSESRKRFDAYPGRFRLRSVRRQGYQLTAVSIEGASVDDGVIHVRKKRRHTQSAGVGQRPVVSLAQSRLFSAGHARHIEQKAEGHYFLARHDSDLVSRWHR
jgi:aminopeptidase N